MKKTTWVIIGLSICVVVLSTALGVVLLQKKTETIIVREPDLYTSSNIFSEPWQKRNSFSLAPFPRNSILYYNTLDYNRGSLQKGVTLYHNGRVYTYSIGNKKNERMNIRLK